MTHEKTFKLNDGKSFTTLRGFAKTLARMPLEVYEAHVNPQKNDFSNWMHHSLGKEELAKKIDGQISKVELELEVLRHLIHEEATNENSIGTKHKS